jgi:2-methylfumaryl-CoA hydratase
MTQRTLKYGRLLSDFEVGATYDHPWEVTVDDGMRALFSASFLDAIPVFASADYARALGFRERPLHSLLVLNLGLSFSVHDVSEQAIAHLAYLDVRFPAPAYAGDTLHARSIVLSAKPSTSGDKGVVEVMTELAKDDGTVVCQFKRRALVRAGSLAGRPVLPYAAVREEPTLLSPLPLELRGGVLVPKRTRGFAGFAEDFVVGDVLVHEGGRTVSESEHMQLTCLVRNTHPLHFDEVYAKSGASFAGTRVVYGGLVFAWVASLASRDTCGNVVWDVGFDEGAHPSGVVAGDTLFAASKVVANELQDAATHRVTFRLVGTKNVPASKLLEGGADLFTPELGKRAGKLPEKVFEIDRTVLMRKRPQLA